MYEEPLLILTVSTRNNIRPNSNSLKEKLKAILGRTKVAIHTIVVCGAPEPLFWILKLSYFKKIVLTNQYLIIYHTNNLLELDYLNTILSETNINSSLINFL